MIGFIRQRISMKYLLVTGATIGLLFTVLYFWLSHKHKAMIMAQVEKQAVILHQQIVLTRQWVSDHGYILVAGEQSAAGAASAAGGHREVARAAAYTRITPAALTRRLSAYADSQHLYTFNLTNLKAKNPDNRPDDFETRAILLFSQNKAGSLSQVDRVGGKHVFRYAAPLVVQTSCLQCHADQGLTVGDVGGCISVLIPFEETRKAMRAENLNLFFAMLGLTLGVVLVLFFLTQKFIFGPIREIRQFTARMRKDAAWVVEGDELREFKQLCYILDEKLKDQHTELSRRIAAATGELAATNRELKILNTAKSNFLADISHELRTPLTSIKGAVDYLLRKDDSRDCTYLEIIRKNAEVLIRTVVDFMDYARIETGHLELDIGLVNPVAVANDVIAAQQAEAEKKHLAIRLGGSGQLDMMADGYRLYQVIANLLSNAIKFSPAGGEIVMVIEADGEKGAVAFTIRDRGPGIPEGQQELIFHKFRQIRQPSRTIAPAKQASSGIGLAICKGLVEAHGGRIWVEPRSGGGSVFCFSLPMIQP